MASQPISHGRGGTYLLTWTTYGTWLPGDDRGFVSSVPDGKGGSVIHNVPGEPYDQALPKLRTRATRKAKGPAIGLNAQQAWLCRGAFNEVVSNYGFVIHAGSVMSNHVHLVTYSHEAEGPRLLNLFKGVSSRRLSQKFGTPEGKSWWTTGGSRRLLPDGLAIETAVNYVRNQSHILASCEH
jgi:REP element-mobilizing transposase RayT